jgi:hypothetical protein
MTIDINEARALAALLKSETEPSEVDLDRASTTITALLDRLAGVEIKERLTYGQWGLTVKLYEKAKADLATAMEAAGARDATADVEALMGRTGDC